MASRPIEEMDEILKCPICHELLDAPKILPCLHRFCTNCLDDYITSKGSPRKLDCPTCRMAFDLPSDGVESIKGDFLMEAILGTHKLEKESQQRGKQRICNSCAQENTCEAFCPECGGLICKGCYEAHRAMKGLNSHINVILMEDLESDNVPSSVISLTAISNAPRCYHHVDQILYFNCKTCHIYICPVCVSISHKEHDIEEVKEVYDSAVEKMEDLLSNITDENVEELENCLQKVNDLKAKVEIEAERCCNQIRSESSKVEGQVTSEVEARIAELQRRKEEQVEELHNRREDELNAVKGRKDTCVGALDERKGKLEEMLRLIGNAKRRVRLFNEKTDMWSTLRAVPEIVTELETLQRETDVRMPDLDWIEGMYSNLSYHLTYVKPPTETEEYLED